MVNRWSHKQSLNCRKVQLRSRYQFALQGDKSMPEQRTLKKARKARRQGKAPSTQAGQFVRETIHHIRKGKHGARSAKQVIAIGLSKARRAGVKLPPPKRGGVRARTRRSATYAYRWGQSRSRRLHSSRRSRASTRALRREGRGAVSRKALARQTRGAARAQSARQRAASARKAGRTRAT